MIIMIMIVIVIITIISSFTKNTVEYIERDMQFENGTSVTVLPSRLSL